MWVVACVVCLFVGYAASGGETFNPFVPAKPERPVLQFLARIAKVGLWLTLALEPNPTPECRSVPCGAVCHSEGW